MAAGLVVGMFVAARAARRRGLDSAHMLDVAVAAIVGGIVGARALYVAVNPGEFAGDWLGVLRIYEGGSVFFGGFLGGVIAAVAVARLRGMNVWKMLDSAAFGVAAGYAIGRFGCLAHGCCYGRLCDLPWAIELHGGLRHPTQMYQVVEGWVLFVFIVWWSGRTKREGSLALAYVAAAGVTRILMELFRADPARGTILGLSTSTTLAIGMVTVAVATLVTRRLNPLP